MRHLKYLYCFVLFCSCKTKKEIFGFYTQKYLAAGFFKSTLILKQDSTFEFRFQGDMYNDIGIGKYMVEGNKLTLIYSTPEWDTLYFPVSDSSDISIGELRIGKDTLKYKGKDAIHRNFHKSFAIKNKKIYFLADNNTIAKASRNYFSKRRKYLLFGSHRVKRRNPLRLIIAYR